MQNTAEITPSVNIVHNSFQFDFYSNCSNAHQGTLLMHAETLQRKLPCIFGYTNFVVNLFNYDYCAILCCIYIYMCVLLFCVVYIYIYTYTHNTKLYIYIYNVYIHTHSKVRPSLRFTKLYIKNYIKVICRRFPADRRLMLVPHTKNLG